MTSKLATFARRWAFAGLVAFGGVGLHDAILLNRPGAVIVAENDRLVLYFPAVYGGKIEGHYRAAWQPLVFRALNLSPVPARYIEERSLPGAAS